jgi:nucleoside-diphosphate-sugar epimerase
MEKIYKQDPSLKIIIRNDMLASVSKRIFPYGRMYRTICNEGIRETIIILGNGNIGHALGVRALKQGKQVITFTQSPPECSSPITYVKVPSGMKKDPEFWTHAARPYLQTVNKVMVVNTIGGSIASGGSTVREMNCDIPLAAIKGISKAIPEESTAWFKVVQLSTAAAANLEAEYGATKREAEKLLTDLELSDLTILRMGYVVEALVRDVLTGTYKDMHKISIEELALLPFAFHMADPQNYNAIRVPIIGMEDLVKAIMNIGSCPPQVRIMDAVNDEVITQEQFFKFFCGLYGKTYRPLYIATEPAMKLAEHHTFGHLVSYAIEHCRKNAPPMDNSAFKNLLHSQPLRLSEIYSLTDGQELIIPRPPIMELIVHIAKNLWHKPHSRADTIQAAYQISASLISQLYQAVQKPETPNILAVPYKSVSEQNLNLHAMENRQKNTFKQ